MPYLHTVYSTGCMCIYYYFLSVDVLMQRYKSNLYFTVDYEPPKNWCPMPDGCVCHYEPLDVNSKEYNYVKNLFESSMPPPNLPAANNKNVKWTWTKQNLNQWHQIVKIERIQNPLLYSQYMGKKKAMDLHNPKGHQNERKLFHGCPKEVTEKISHLGFNRSFAGKNGNYIVTYIDYCSEVWLLYRVVI